MVTVDIASLLRCSQDRPRDGDYTVRLFEAADRLRPSRGAIRVEIATSGRRMRAGRYTRDSL